jgi:uncharacterized membrane protein
MNYKVSYKRHLAKTISYRILSTTIGFIGIWLVSGSLKVGAAFGVVELLYKPIQYYIHERIWYKWIKYGLNLDSEKKKKNIGLTEGKIKSQIKIHDGDSQKTQQPSPPKPKSGKKVLNYSSNR